MLDPTTMHDDAKDLFRRAQPEALKAMPLGAPRDLVPDHGVRVHTGGQPHGTAAHDLRSALERFPALEQG